MQELTANDVAHARLISLLLADRAVTDPSGIVAWFGALQAQDLASVKWSLGVRLPGITESQVDAAIESGRIVRTWPMRGTIHLVPATDVRWMLEVTGSRAMAASARRREQLGLDLEAAERAATVLREALAGNHRLRRSAALALLEDAGIPTAGQAGYHLLWYASQAGVTCIGPNDGKEQTFVLLEDWCPDQTRFERREAVAELALRYFRSHGPATVKDFAGWTGLTLTDCRRAVVDNDGRLVTASFAGDPVHLTSELAGRLAEGPAASRTPAVALPGFDEFMLGYKDRRVQVPDGRMNDIVPGGNGMFRATIVADGRAIATWTRRLMTGRVEITVEPFARMSERLLRQAEQSFATYASYLGRTADIRYLRR